MDQFSIFGLAALFAVCFKVLILFQVRANSPLSSAFVYACLALIFQNALEFCGYITFAANPHLATPFLHALIISLYLVCGSMVYLCAVISELKSSKLIGLVFGGSALALTVVHIAGFSVSGFQQVGYSINSEPGPAYVLFQLFAPLSAVMCITGLVLGLRSPDLAVVKRCRLALVAVLPLCAIGIIVTLLRVMGYNSTTAIVMPFASTFLVWLLMYEARGDIVSFSLKWRFIWSILRYAKDTSIHEWPELTDRIQLIEAMRMCDNNQSEVAKLLKSSPATVSRKCAKYSLGGDRIGFSPLPAKSQSFK